MTKRVVVVFLLLSLLVVGALLIGKLADKGAEPAKVGSSLFLSDDAAVSVYREVDDLRQQALERRDFSIVARFLTPSSPMRDRLKTTIRSLKRNGILVDERWDVDSIQVTESASTRIELRVEGTHSPTFTDVKGRPVEAEDEIKQQQVRCVLRLVASEWLLDDCTVETSFS